MKCVYVGAALVFVAATSYAGSDQTASAFVLCKSKKEVRTIRVLPNEKYAENCSITYSKGMTEEVLSSNRPMKTCRSILKNIQTNLENSKWSCRSVQTARVMTSSEILQ